MKISVVRGAFANPFEMQSYEVLAKAKNIDLQLITSNHPLSSSINLPQIKLLSPTDLPNFPYKYPILNRLFTDAHYLFGFEKAITGSDIVHVAETYYHYTHQAIEAKKKGLIKKIVSTVWEVIPFNNEGIKGRKEFKNDAYKYIDKFICVTKLAAECLIKEGVDVLKIEIIPAGIDIQRFTSKLKNSRNQELKTEFKILCVARLTEEKGIGELVAAVKEIRKNNPNISLTLVGSGPLKNKLQKYPWIKFLSLPYSKIEKIYQDADIFCLPSKDTRYWQEQFGMALVEAMACGLPIVTTNSGAISEVCGEAAIYAKQGDVHDLQLKIDSIITNATLSKKMGNIARQRAVKLYDQKIIADKILKVYKNICP